MFGQTMYKNETYCELNVWGNICGEKISETLGMPIQHYRMQRDYKRVYEECVIFSSSLDENEDAIWSYKSDELCVIDFSEALDRVIEIFSTRIDLIRNIKEIYPDSEVRIVIVSDILDGMIPSVSLSNEQIGFLKNIEASFEIDWYDLRATRNVNAT